MQNNSQIRNNRRQKWATGRPVGQSLTTISSDVWKWSGSGDISVPSGYD